MSATSDRRRSLTRAFSSEPKSPFSRRTLGILLVTAGAILLGLYGLVLRPSQQAHRRNSDLDSIVKRVAQGEEVWANEPWETVADPDQALAELKQRLIRAGRRHFSEGKRLQSLGDTKSHQEAVEQFVFSANTHRFLAEKNTDPHRIFQGECLYMAGIAALSIPDPSWARALLLDAVGAFQIAAKQLENEHRQQAVDECRERVSMCQQELDSLGPSATPP